MSAPILRSMLSVPGNQQRFIDKALAVPADIISFDLEDSVAWDDKPAARALVAAALPRFDARGRLRCVRINGLDTGLAEQDLTALVSPSLDVISLPKVLNATTITQIDHYLTLLERTRGLEPGAVRLLPWIETASAVVHAYEICAASPRILGFTFGADDYATDSGVVRTPEAAELNYPRAAAANAGAAAGVVPIDTPTTEFKDLAKFERDLVAARHLGYRGKFCIHPTQVEIANRVFAPSADELAWAAKIIDAYEAGKAEGRGAIALAGVMIDDPIVDRAHQLLDWTQRVAERDALLSR
jgi:citrate lyase subunit beta/citryl-CoA lyase